MKQYKLYVTGILSLILFIACDVNTLDEVKKLDQVVSLVQVGDGTVVLTQDNLIVDRENSFLRKVLVLPFPGLKPIRVSTWILNCCTMKRLKDVRH